VVRVLYLTLSVIGYAATLGGRVGRGGVVVLCYHGVMPAFRKAFHSQMSRIADRVVSPEMIETVPSFRVGRTPRVCITFDDGFENLLENALPVLDEFGIGAMVFAVPGNLGRTPQWRISPGHSEYGERLMTVEQLRHESGGNIAIGSHTQTHPVLPELSREQIRWELAESKRNLETMTGRPVVDLALPHGACDDVVLDVAREVGYERIYTLTPRMHRSHRGEDVIGRFSISPDVWPIEFRLTCAGAYAWLGPWRRFLKAVRRQLPRK
jgi:peptidoglycan/xylan/chitin deacetylase (PgdA/CDA1 family)